MVVSSRNKRMLLVATAAASLTAGYAGSAYAQTTDVEEVIVTARKREERLLDVPVAVSAVTAKEIETLGLASLNDVASITPGFYISNYSTERNDRTNQTVTVRGMPPSITTSPSASVFINGAPIAGSGFIEGVGDLERVEVIRGPQSAYFGRATFAGAINLITKTPENDYKGSVSALYGSDNWYDLQGSFEGPIVREKLAFRLTGAARGEEGQYTNAADGSHLGGQTTKSVGTTLSFTPTDSLKVKAFVTYWQDKDEAPATGKFTLANGFNCKAPGGTALYMCGTLPHVPLNTLANNFPIGGIFNSLILNNGAGFAGPLGPAKHESPGLLRRAWHGDAEVEYDIPNTGIAIDSITAYDYQYLETISNSQAEDVSSVLNPNYGRLPNTLPYPTFLFVIQNRVKDFSQELRITSDQKQRLRWMVGGNFFQTYPNQSDVYGIIATGLVTFDVPPPTGTVIHSYSGFGSLAYDILDNLTVTAEGRYQADNVKSVNALTGAQLVTAQGALNTTFKNFIPRANIAYKFQPDLMAYASFSEGVNPGTFNSAFATETQARNLAIYQGAGIGINVAPEKLYNYEIGMKGRFWDNRAQVTLAAYYDQWKNQIIQIPLQIYINAASLVLDNITRPYSNTGNTNLHGIELESIFALTKQFTLTLNGAYNGSSIKNYVCSSYCPAIIGSNNAPSGNHLANTPLYNGLVAGEYRNHLAGDYEWYTRAEYVFAGPIYADVTNVVKGPAKNVANFRVGVQAKAISLEAFVLNAFNDYYYTNVTRDTELARTSAAGALYVGMPVMRQFGIRAKYNF